MRTTKKSLWMSALSLCLCAMMLLGTTFAWFTDSVVNKDNRIEAGTLLVDLEMKNPTSGDFVSLKNNPEIKAFDYDKWEPSYSTFATFRVKNEGTLSIKYELEL